jgi:hypothetical protein
MWYARVRYATPANKITRVPTMATRVRRACTTAGSRKTLVALLTASTPVIAVHPLANALTRSHAPAVAVAAGAAGGAITPTGAPAFSQARTTPMTRIRVRHPTKAYVGTTNARPDSRTPRRFTAAMIARIVRQSASV